MQVKVDPHAWLANILARLPDHPAKQIDELLPWTWNKARRIASAAAALTSRKPPRCTSDAYDSAVIRPFRRDAARIRAMSGQIVDASLIAAPKQHNTQEEKQAIKESRIPEDWKDK